MADNYEKTSGSQARWDFQGDEAVLTPAALSGEKGELPEKIEEERLTQKSLEERARKFQVIFDQSFQLIGLLKADGTILELNQKALEFGGLPLEQTVGRLLWEVPWRSGTPETINRIRKAVLEAAEDHFVRFEVSLPDAEGRMRTIDFSLKPVGDEKGRVGWLIAEGRDITERMEAEKALIDSGEKLRRLSAQIITAQENERKRVAKEIHDSIGQYLSAVKFKVEEALFRHSLIFGPENSLEHLRAVIPVLQGAVEEVRRISMNLSPSIIDDLGILATINWFCREFQLTFSDIRIKTRIRLNENEVPKKLKTIIFRIMQEALNNVAKHSQATKTLLSLIKKDEAIELIIRDDGQGFDQEKKAREDEFRRGLGLGSMKERAEFSGGTLSIRSTQGKGTTVKAVWPLLHHQTFFHGISRQGRGIMKI